ncbi:hypothetical protein [Streptomyces sp. NPDC088350]|uniref:hypothetical protein n=1 Tax=Streptomyces sp. NPDC088350 TaxID=3365854 RepID=UPI003820055D
MLLDSVRNPISSSTIAVALVPIGIAGLMGAPTPSLGVLIAARVLLGFGTSAAYPAARIVPYSGQTGTSVEILELPTKTHDVSRRRSTAG